MNRNRKKVDLPAPWIKWYQEDLPCRFSPEDARESRAFLVDALGRAWMTSQLGKGKRSGHPFIQWWRSEGADAFLMLNALADDLRQLVEVPGLDGVLSDFRRRRECLSAWHVIHSAAMCERGRKGSVVQFYEKGRAKIPDFLVRGASGMIAVEAKYFQPSKHERMFHSHAYRIREAVVSTALGGDRIHPAVIVVVRDPKQLPEVTEVARTVQAGVSEWRTGEISTKRDLFSVFIREPLSKSPAIGVYKCVLCFCPRADEDALRVQDRARDAAQQLHAVASETDGGLAWFGLYEHQDPDDVRELLVRRSEAEKYESIDWSLLSRFGTETGPPKRTVLDRIGLVGNPRHTPVERPLNLEVVGRREDVFSASRPAEAISAYRSMSVLGRVRAQEGAGLYLPKVHWLTPDLLA